MISNLLKSTSAASALCLALLPVPVAAQTAPTPDDVQAMAEDAYVFTYPLVMMYRTMYLQAIDETSPSYAGGFGEWYHLGMSTPDDHDIVTPNNDTPYSYAWVDLRAEPWVLTVPEIEEGRFCTSQWDDLWGYVIDNVGSSKDGNGGTSVLLAAPVWEPPHHTMTSTTGRRRDIGSAGARPNRTIRFGRTSGILSQRANSPRNSGTSIG